MFTHRGIQYRDCWIETTVRCRGGKNMDGLYILGHYADYETALAALTAHKAANPKAFASLILQPA